MHRITPKNSVLELSGSYFRTAFLVLQQHCIDGLLPSGEPESGHPRCCTFCEGSDHSLQSAPSG